LARLARISGKKKSRLVRKGAGGELCLMVEGEWVAADSSERPRIALGLKKHRGRITLLVAVKENGGTGRTRAFGAGKRGGPAA